MSGVLGLEELSREKLIGLVRDQAAMIAQLREANTALREVNAALEERGRRLERQVSRNSGNSSMPPSSDDLPGRVKPAPKRAKNSGRKRGKQKGAAGNALPWVKVPDETVPHRPQGCCGCGADLAAARDVGIERSHQVHDLPEVHIRVWQHDVYRVRCGCGETFRIRGRSTARAPGGLSAAPGTDLGVGCGIALIGVAQDRLGVGVSDMRVIASW